MATVRIETSALIFEMHKINFSAELVDWIETAAGRCWGRVSYSEVVEITGFEACRDIAHLHVSYHRLT